MDDRYGKGREIMSILSLHRLGAVQTSERGKPEESSHKAVSVLVKVVIASSRQSARDCKLKAKCTFLACQCAREKMCWVDADDMPTEKELVNALGKPIVAKLIVDVDPWGRAMYRRTLLSAKVPKVPCMPLSAMFCARSAAPRTKAASRSPGRTWTTRAPVA